MLKDVYLAGSVRTAIGGFCGSLAEVPAPVLAATAIKAAMQRAGVKPQDVDEVILGNVLAAGLGQNIARQASIGAGLSPQVGATTVNKLCGSGLKSVMFAAQAIQCGDAQLIVAGGTENMSAAPYILPKGRNGYRMGHGEVWDSLIKDGLWDAYNNLHMGVFGDRCAAKYQFTQKDQDDYAVTSYQRAIQAQKDGTFRDEIVPVEITTRKGTTVVDQDEEPGRFNEEKMRALKPAFGKDGSVTAGNASSVNDGAAAVVVASAEKVKQLGLKPQAKILGYSTYSREPEWFTLAPVCAIDNLLKKLGLKVDDVDLFELNEAFSVVPMAAMKDLAIRHDRLNIHGGAVALGHPIGASGARTLATLLNAMPRRQAKVGVNALCIGGGEAVAMAIQRC